MAYLTIWIRFICGISFFSHLQRTIYPISAYFFFFHSFASEKKNLPGQWWTAMRYQHSNGIWEYDAFSPWGGGGRKNVIQFCLRSFCVGRWMTNEEWFLLLWKLAYRLAFKMYWTTIGTRKDSCVETNFIVHTIVNVVEKYHFVYYIILLSLYQRHPIKRC